MIQTRRWFCALLAGVVVAAAVVARAQFPRANIELEPGGAPTDFMFRAEQREIFFLPDSRRLITRDYRQPAEDFQEPEHFRMRLWDARAGSFIASLVEGPSAEVRAWSPDGTLIAAAVDDDTYVWDARAGTLLWKTALNSRGCFFEGDRLLALAAETPELIDLKTGQAVRLLDCDFWQDNKRPRGRFARPCGIWYLKNPPRIVDWSKGKTLLALDPAVKIHWEGMSIDGRFFWYTGDDSEFVLWHLPDQTERRVSTEKGAYPNQFLAFAPDGETAVLHGEPILDETWLGRLRAWGVPV
jgi:hypothetical protein